MRLVPLTALRAVFLAVFATTGCEQLVAPERFEALRKDLDPVAMQIKAAEVEDAEYTGVVLQVTT